MFNVGKRAWGHSQQPQHYQTMSKENYATMNQYILIMIWVQNVVFTAINEQLTKRNHLKLTLYQWLLIQLFPSEALHDDLFSRVTDKCITFLVKNGHNDSTAIALKKSQTQWFVMVVDEAQVLLKHLNLYFLSSDASKQQSAFLALLKAMDTTAALSDDSKMGFLLFSATAMLLDDFTKLSNSVVVKRPLAKDREFVFTKFPPLTAQGVQNYLSSFLDLDLHMGNNTSARKGKHVSNASVVQHVSKWLRGVMGSKFCIGVFCSRASRRSFRDPRTIFN
jgi:hypothetical protein